MHRIVVTVAAPATGRGMSAITPFTFRPGPNGLVEDAVLRGLHPMMSHRLRLARLSEFELERLPAGEDLYVFHGVGRSNPKDERLFALAEVRDLTPLCDEHGNVTALPELERMLVGALERIRGVPGAAQAEPPAAVESHPAARVADDRAGPARAAPLVRRLAP